MLLDTELFSPGFYFEKTKMLNYRTAETLQLCKNKTVIASK